MLPAGDNLFQPKEKLNRVTKEGKGEGEEKRMNPQLLLLLKPIQE